MEANPVGSTVLRDDDERLANLGYKPQLNRVLGFFSNFAVAFTYLSPMVGIYSLFVLGVGTGGPSYIWLTFIPLIGMLFVALVFGELASHYPVAGSLYQYSKFSVGPKFGWFVGWFYGIALLVTVAAVDTGVVGYFTQLMDNWFSWKLDPTAHGTILWITVMLLAIQTTLNITGARVMARVARLGVYVEIIGTFGIFMILWINGFNHDLGFLFDSKGAAHTATNGLGLDFSGHWLTGAALIAVLAPVYIFYGFESAGDIAEETQDASRQIPRAMRHALIWGGVGSFFLTAGLLLAMPENNPVKATVEGGGVPFILGQLSEGMQDFLLVLIIFAFFSCGTSIQGAGSRLAFSFARDGGLPASGWVSKVHHRFKTPVNALVAGAVITLMFVLLVFPSPDKDIEFLFITYPANVTPLVALVSFGVSGIYLAFLLAVIGSIVAHSRGWVPEGAFKLGKWTWPVLFAAVSYLGLMLLNVVLPSGLDSPRAVFNIDWITATVMFVITIVGTLVFLVTRPDRKIGTHLHDDLEPTGAERV